MSVIGDEVSGLERPGAQFTVESLAKEIRQEWIESALSQTGKESVRKRLLPATLTVWLTILMGLYRRTSYVKLLEKMHGTWWTRDHWSGEKPPCSRAVTKARDRVGIKPMKVLFERTATTWVGETEGLVVHGLRVQSVDGSTLKTPDTPKNARRFGRPGSSRGRAGYPQLKIVTLADVGTRLIKAASWGKYRKAEINLTRSLVGEIEPDTLVLVDSGLSAYDFLWKIRTRGAHFIGRIGDQAKPKIVHEFGPGDALVKVTLRSSHRKRYRDMPKTWTLRMITYRPEGGDEDIRLLTDLMPESSFTYDECANMYHDRWENETIFDELKTHLCDCATVNRAVVFRSKTPDRVIQELLGILIAYNAIRKTICEAARDKEVEPRRVSFTASLERIREATCEMMRLPTRRLGDRYEYMLAAIMRALVPKRPGRSFPRAVKIKMSCYPRKQRRRRAS